MRLSTIAFNRFKRSRLSMLAAGIVLVLVFVALFAPIISPHDPFTIDTDKILESPSMRHPFGTDDLGRDVLSRMIYGSRVSMSVGFVAVGIAISIGILVGSLAGYFGGKVDAVLMRFVDIMLTFPSFFLLLSVLAIVPNPNIYVIMVIIGLTGWMGPARFVRAEFLSLKERDFVMAAKVSGASNARLIFRHILPNALSPIFVNATLGVGGAILAESGLSFLGFGIQPPSPSWGNILTLGKDNIEVAWWLSVYPGMAILITVLSYNLVGEGLRDAMDPRLWEMED